MSTSYAGVAFSYGLVFTIAGIATYVYKPDLVTKLLPATPAKSTALAADPPKTTSKAKNSKKSQTEKQGGGQGTSVKATGSEEAKSIKKRKITAPIDKTVTATTVNGQKKELPRDAENDINDKDFAQQLARAQMGTNLREKSQQKGAAPGRLAASLQPKQSSGGLSTDNVSSTTGRDADDDRSSVESPQQQSASGKDISDMLEVPAAAPSTLRLKVPDQPKKTKPASKPVEQAETKKQRQQRLKKEEQKRLNQEAERLRQQQLQQHLSTARTAAGTSNQTKANNFASTANAWQKNSNNTPTDIENKPAPATLLDTFEPSSSTSESVQAQPLSKIPGQRVSGNSVSALESQVGEKTASALGATGRENGVASSEMSEEEQMQRVREEAQEDAWEAVPTKKAKRKGRKDNDTSSEASFVVSEPPPPAPPVQQRVTKPQSIAVPKPQASVNRFNAIEIANTSGLQDDEWQA